jgi:hypothetical protein
MFSNIDILRDKVTLIHDHILNSAHRELSSIYREFSSISWIAVKSSVLSKLNQFTCNQRQCSRSAFSMLKSQIMWNLWETFPQYPPIRQWYSQGINWYKLYKHGIKPNYQDIPQGLVTVPFWVYWTSPEKVANIPKKGQLPTPGECPDNLA